MQTPDATALTLGGDDAKPIVLGLRQQRTLDDVIAKEIESPQSPRSLAEYRKLYGRDIRAHLAIMRYVYEDLSELLVGGVPANLGSA